LHPGSCYSDEVVRWATDYVLKNGSDKSFVHSFRQRFPDHQRSPCLSGVSRWVEYFKATGNYSPNKDKLKMHVKLEETSTKLAERNRWIIDYCSKNNASYSSYVKAFTARFPHLKIPPPDSYKKYAELFNKTGTYVIQRNRMTVSTPENIARVENEYNIDSTATTISISERLGMPIHAVRNIEKILLKRKAEKESPNATGKFKFSLFRNKDVNFLSNLYSIDHKIERSLRQNWIIFSKMPFPRYAKSSQYSERASNTTFQRILGLSNLSRTAQLFGTVYGCQ